MRLQQDSKLWALRKIVITTATIITSFKKLLYLQFTSSSSFYIALKIVANNIKYVWQLTGFFFSNTCHFYCNLFCYLLTYLFTYLFFYFLLCINVVDLLSIKKKKKIFILCSAPAMGKDELDKLACPDVLVFTAQLVEHCRVNSSCPFFLAFSLLPFFNCKILLSIIRFCNYPPPSISLSSLSWTPTTSIPCRSS